MDDDPPHRGDLIPHVVILGGGFAGLTACKALRRAPVRITLVDRRNHHLFQPLLYQVATAALSPSDIAAPLRSLLAKQKNAEVRLAGVASIDTCANTLDLDDGASLRYDYLIVATGAENAYFGNDQWAKFAPGLKDIPDALTIRERFLLAFEHADDSPDDAERRRLLTFAVVGAGPTGVELAGTMAELARRAFRQDYKRVDTSGARILLIDAADRVLATFDPKLSAAAQRDLESLGVEVVLNTRIDEITDRGVRTGDEWIETPNVYWAAGIKASPVGAMLGAQTDRMGRVRVSTTLTIDDHPEVFVIGDLAHAKLPSGEEIPGIAPAAMQMGRHAARSISDAVKGNRTTPPFRYKDKGMLATIGRARAVGGLGRARMTGLFAWIVWLAIHIWYLIGFRNKILVMIQWAWAYFTFQRGARLITGVSRARRK